MFMEFCKHDSCGVGLNVSYGSLSRICQATGKLQYIDATGSIDAVIPDLPSSWNMNTIYEVTEFSLVLEGRPETRSQTWILENDLLSFSSIFNSIESEKQTKFVVYVHFFWSNAICRDFPVCRCLSSSAQLESGTFHLLHLAHKLPVQPKFHADMSVSARSSFAEATVLPLDLNIATPVSILHHELEKNCESDFSFKRCKTNHPSVCSKKVELGSSFSHGNSSCCQASDLITLSLKRKAQGVRSSSPVQIPCAVLVRRVHGQRIALSGVLYFNVDRNSDILCSTSPKKYCWSLILKTFSSISFYMLVVIIS